MGYLGVSQLEKDKFCEGGRGLTGKLRNAILTIAAASAPSVALERAREPPSLCKFTNSTKVVRLTWELNSLGSPVRLQKLGPQPQPARQTLSRPSNQQASIGHSAAAASQPARKGEQPTAASKQQTSSQQPGESQQKAPHAAPQRCSAGFGFNLASNLSCSAEKTKICAWDLASIFRPHHPAPNFIMQRRIVSYSADPTKKI